MSAVWHYFFTFLLGFSFLLILLPLTFTGLGWMEKEWSKEQKDLHLYSEWQVSNAQSFFHGGLEGSVELTLNLPPSGDVQHCTVTSPAWYCMTADVCDTPSDPPQRYTHPGSPLALSCQVYSLFKMIPTWPFFWHPLSSWGMKEGMN